uniref:Uncharacterized protein n=1 Tax=Yersinia enterocolitica TaxID=630 RepID=B0RKJ4_YEREN|nr:hypothetical protein [Yersinia enterocolitica]
MLPASGCSSAEASLFFVLPDLLAPVHGIPANKRSTFILFLMSTSWIADSIIILSASNISGFISIDASMYFLSLSTITEFFSLMPFDLNPSCADLARTP